MKHPLLLAERFLAAVLLIATGASNFGCGDTASVNPVVELSRLSVSPGTLQPGFSGETTQYNVDLSSDVASVTITAQAAVAGDAVTINGQTTTSSVITLGAAGTTTPVNIVVSESGTNSRTYTVLLVRAGLAGNNSIESLTVSPGDLAPGFDANTQDYTVDVANNVGSITVTPTSSDPAATMTVNGQSTTSGENRTITLNPPGQSTLITIVVTAQNSSNKTYRITVSRGVSANRNLQSLTISSGTLSPAFSANNLDYTVNVASTVISVTVRPTLADSTATMTVNGQATNSGQTRTIQLGTPNSTTPIIIIVTAQNGTQNTYTVGISRAALGGNNNLQSLTGSPGSLSPSFSASRTSYTMDVGSTVSSVTVTPRLQDTSATMTVNGQTTTSGQNRSVTLNGPGSNTVINVVVTAPNGAQKLYAVTVSREALGGNNNLQSLAVSSGTLSPSFNANRTSYTVSVGSSVDSISVTPRLADTDATMRVNGQATNSGQARVISLNGAGSDTDINIVVTAPNSTQKIYSITVERAAPASNNNLSALSVTEGSLSPGFASGRLNYTVGVATDISSINISATKADSNAVMSGDVTAGTGVATGQAAIQLNGAGTSTSVSITVTAPNGSSKTYAITVNRTAPADPPTPTVAPDLIEEDDSCPLDIPNNPDQCVVGSREDNITNVTTPRFRIPQPGAGQTPSLYSGDDQVPANFNQGANTLQPTSALPDGEHSISYTLSNGGNESGNSPALIVTIDSAPPPTP
jgi:hypothetical protein